MAERPKPKAPKKRVSCEVCKKEIPHSTALTSEGSAYTYYFCGSACFEKYRRQAAVRGEPTTKPR